MHETVNNNNNNNKCITTAWDWPSFCVYAYVWRVGRQMNYVELPTHSVVRSYDHVACCVIRTSWAATLWVHICINVCVLYLGDLLPIEKYCWVRLFVHASFWDLLNWVSWKSICDIRFCFTDCQRSWNCCCTEAVWPWALLNKASIMEKGPATVLSMKPPTASWNK